MIRCRIVIMRGTIQLDRKPLGGAVKVDDVRPNAVLATKFMVAELAPLEVNPEQCLGVREARAQLTSARLEYHGVVFRRDHTSTVAGVGVRYVSLGG